MAYEDIAADVTINNTTKVIDYVGAVHGLATARYYTGIYLHRWLGTLADDAQASSSSSDYMDMTKLTPSSRNGIDQIIQMLNGYTLTTTMIEHLYDCSVIQGSAGTYDIYDGFTIIAGQGANVQLIQNGARITNDFWNYGIKGTHTGGTSTTVLTDSTRAWTVNAYVGYYIENTTDGSWGVVTANTATTMTVAALYDGTGNTFEASDAYSLVIGLNSDSANGVSHRFLILVSDEGVDIDGRRVLGQTRVWGKTYSEFKINGTARGNNVIALNYATDNNNSTAISTIAGYTTITQATEGYGALDINADATDEYFYSIWDGDKPTRSINDFYQRMKWVQVQDTTATMFGLNAELFRGPTHEITYGSGTGTFDDSNPVTFSNGATAQVLAANGTNKIWVQLLTGAAPVATNTISQTVPDAAGGTITVVTERTLSFPFCGSSTGSSLLGGYGVALQTNDLTYNDRIVALDNVTYSTPNNQSFYVTGVVSTEDYALVGLKNGGGTDIDSGQFLISTALTSGGATVVLKAGTETPGTGTQSATDTPATGTIRIKGDDGIFYRVPYTGRTSGSGIITFTGCTNTPTAAVDNQAYISYIDKLADGTSLSYSAVYHTDRALFGRVRDGAATPIKTFEGTGTFGSAGGSISVSRQSDL